MIGKSEYRAKAVILVKEFRSKLEDIMPAEELDFEPTPAFGSYRQFFPEEATAHPAKANTKLIEFLIEKFTKEGDTVLDPMAGTGSTGVIASLHNRNTILIDIEEKFVEWMKKAKELVDKYQTLFGKGEIKIIQGDARELSKLLKNVDHIITSPPYSETLSVRSGGMKGMKNAPNSTVGSDGNPQLYSTNPKNIGNLPHGNIDVIITSPPYADSLRYIKQDREKRLRKLIELDREKAMRGIKWSTTSIEALKRQVAREIDGYGESEENIGNLPHGDIGIIEKVRDREIEKLRKILMKNGRPTYLSEMLKVYYEMWKVLKPFGLAIVIVKPFIRNKEVIDLPYHTWLLMQRVGFKLEKLYKLRLKQKSFWRVLYYRKFPEVPRINHEYILVCRKVVNVS